jgi:uncharacterized membrane protein
VEIDVYWMNEYKMPYPYPYSRLREAGTRLGGARASEPSSINHEGGTPTVSSSTKYQHSVVIAAPVEHVFAFAADFENDPRWRAEVRRMRYASERPVRVGTRAVETARVLGRELETETVVTAYEPNRRVAAESVSGPVPIVGSRDFEVVPGGTRFTYTLETDVSSVPLFRLMSPLLARWYRGRIEGYLGTLKRILESQASSSKAA